LVDSRASWHWRVKLLVVPTLPLTLKYAFAHPQHEYAVNCGLDMCKRYSLGTAACPFCRALVAGFRTATLGEMRQQ